MSASVATLVAGLPNHQMSPENYTATDYSNHMNLDHHEDSTADSTDQNSQQDDQETRNSEDRNEDHNRAVGNLLAALSSHPNNVDSKITNQDAAQAEGPQLLPQDQTHNIDLEADLQAVVANAPMPTIDAPAANELTPINTDLLYQTYSEGIFNLPTAQDNSQHIQPDQPLVEQVSPVMQDPEPVLPAPMRREYEAFARLVFPDGNFYLNTYSCELGRDVLAYRAALERQQEEIKATEAGKKADPRPRSAGARSHNPSERLRRQVGSQVQGSIVSEAGGFAGIDEEDANQQLHGQNRSAHEPNHSSQASNSSGVVKPHELHLNPTLLPYDYKRSSDIQAQFMNGEVERDDEKPAPLTSEHLPNPNFCPLIPIHATMQTDKSEVEGHRSISRRHVKIYWNFEKDTWEMKTLGRNGAFVNDNFIGPKESARLEDGAVIQVSNVQLTFRLPIQKKEEEEPTNEESEIVDTPMDDVLPSIERRPSDVTVDGTRRGSTADPQPTTKINLKIKPQTQPAPPQSSVGADGQPTHKKRGPGRPPKDGIMSTRERKELEKARKLADAKAANGGKTPPPSGVRTKVNPKPTPTATEEPEQGDVKLEKRKYKKRKRDANGDPIPGEEGEESGPESEDQNKAKKARTQREKSESPAYIPKEELTEEQLQRPTDSYAVLLYKLLTECYPEALPLKQIYRRLKQQWPYFIYGVGTEGWQSSVRHNLNSEVEKLFTKGDKEGKGFAWRAIPGRTPSQQDKKKATSQQSIPAKPKTTPPKPYIQNGNIQWQQPAGPYPAGPWQGPPPNGNWPLQGGLPQTGVPPQMAAGSPMQQGGPNAGHPPHHMHPQTTLSQNPSHPGQPGNMSTSLPQQVSQMAEVTPSNQSLPETMPCTLQGIEAIRRFQQEMFKMIGEEQPRRTKWEGIFASAKRRVLYGYPESNNTEYGDTEEEQTIMRHIYTFVRKFKNPNYRISTYEKQCLANGVTPQPSNFVPPPEPVTAQKPQSVSTTPNTVVVNEDAKSAESLVQKDDTNTSVSEPATK